MLPTCDSLDAVRAQQSFRNAAERDHFGAPHAKRKGSQQTQNVGADRRGFPWVVPLAMDAVSFGESPFY
jgi:hypothetical protein